MDHYGVFRWRLSIRFGKQILHHVFLYPTELITFKRYPRISPGHELVMVAVASWALTKKKAWLHLTSLPCNAAAQNADGGQEVFFLYSRSSLKLSLCWCFALFIVAPVYPTEKPTRFFYWVFKNVVHKGKKCKKLTKECRKNSLSSRSDKVPVRSLK